MISLGNQAFCPWGASWTVTVCFSTGFRWRAPWLGTLTDMNEWTTGGAMDRDHMLFPTDFIGGLLNSGLWVMNEWINHWLLETEQLSPWDLTGGTWSGGSLTGNFEGTANYQGMGRRRFRRQLSLSIGTPLGNLGGGSIFWELWEIVEGGLLKWSISLSAGALLVDPEEGTPVLGIQKVLETGIFSP